MSSQGALGPNDNALTQWSTNEWDPLLEIIVGSAENARFPFRDVSSRNTEFTAAPIEEIPQGRFAQWVIEETQEDLAVLEQTLETAGVQVHRPKAWDHAATIENQIWRSAGFYTYCPRDILIMIDGWLLETPNAMRGRYHEAFAYRDILQSAFARGARWFGAPKPMLEDAAFDTPPSRPVPKNIEPIFDAANILRFGDDLLYLLSSTGNERGAQWLQTMLGSKYRVHTCELNYYGSHIDTSIIPLRPGLLLCNPERVAPDMLPEFLKTWDIIYCPEPAKRSERPDGYDELCLASRWMGMNVLSVRPDLVIVDRVETDLIRLIESHGIDAIALPLRHSQMLGGGFHCVTADLRRCAMT